MAAAVAKWCSKYKTPPVRAALYRTGKKVKGCPPGGVYKVVKHWQPVKAKKKKKSKSVKKSKTKNKSKWRKLGKGRTITPRGIAASHERRVRQLISKNTGMRAKTGLAVKRVSGRPLIFDEDE